MHKGRKEQQQKWINRLELSYLRENPFVETLEKILSLKCYAWQ